MKRITRRVTTSTFVVAMVVAVFSHTHVGYGVEPLPPSTFKQDNFVIGASCWPPFPDNDELDARYREIAEANFTLVIGPMAGDKAKHIKLCGKYNLAAIVDCFRAPFDNLPTSDACWGYRLSDEPATSDFPMLRKQATALRKARPSKLGYINLFPNYADPERQLGAPTYDEYVAKFVDELDPAVLCMDYYPFFKPGKDGRDGYCDNLETMRKYALKKGIPFWNWFNSLPFGYHTDPTEAQLRWQIYTALAYGAKGVIYFNYNTPPPLTEFPKGGGLIDHAGRRMQKWYQAQRINAAIKNLAPTLMRLTSTSVVRVKPGDHPTTILNETPLKSIARDAVDPPLDYLVGAFRHADGRRAVLLCNYHFAYTAWPTVEFDIPVADVKEVDQATGCEVPVRDDSPNMPGTQISLDAGEGRLFLLPEKNNSPK